MIRKLTQLECIVDEKYGRFECDENTTLAQARVMLSHFFKVIDEIEESITKAAAEVDVDQNQEAIP